MIVTFRRFSFAPRNGVEVDFFHRCLNANLQTPHRLTSTVSAVERVSPLRAAAHTAARRTED